jgi:L-threonylcarbamoyladenylate synthase
MAEIEAHFPEVLTLESSELEALTPATTGIPSTVAKWTGGSWEILRQGGVQLE